MTCGSTTSPTRTTRHHSPRSRARRTRPRRHARENSQAQRPEQQHQPARALTFTGVHPAFVRSSLGVQHARNAPQCLQERANSSSFTPPRRARRRPRRRAGGPRRSTTTTTKSPPRIPLPDGLMLLASPRGLEAAPAGQRASQLLGLLTTHPGVVLQNRGPLDECLSLCLQPKEQARFVPDGRTPRPPF